MPVKFKRLDYLIFTFFAFFFLSFGYLVFILPKTKGDMVEVYVNSQLVYAQRLQKEQKEIFIPTDIGGVTIEFIDNKVRVLNSNSPRQIAVKQGFIDTQNEVIIGIPDKLVIKILGNKDEETLDFIAK